MQKLLISTRQVVLGQEPSTCCLKQQTLFIITANFVFHIYALRQAKHEVSPQHLICPVVLSMGQQRLDTTVSPHAQIAWNLFEGDKIPQF